VDGVLLLISLEVVFLSVCHHNVLNLSGFQLDVLLHDYVWIMNYVLIVLILDCVIGAVRYKREFVEILRMFQIPVQRVNHIV